MAWYLPQPKLSPEVGLRHFCVPFFQDAQKLAFPQCRGLRKRKQIGNAFTGESTGNKRQLISKKETLRIFDMQTVSFFNKHKSFGLFQRDGFIYIKWHEKCHWPSIPWNTALPFNLSTPATGWDELSCQPGFDWAPVTLTCPSPACSVPPDPLSRTRRWWLPLSRKSSRSLWFSSAAMKRFHLSVFGRREEKTCPRRNSKRSSTTAATREASRETRGLLSAMMAPPARERTQTEHRYVRVPSYPCQHSIGKKKINSYWLLKLKIISNSSLWKYTHACRKILLFSQLPLWMWAMIPCASQAI